MRRGSCIGEPLIRRVSVFSHRRRVEARKPAPAILPQPRLWGLKLKNVRVMPSFFRRVCARSAHRLSLPSYYQPVSCARLSTHTSASHGLSYQLVTAPMETSSAKGKNVAFVLHGLLGSGTNWLYACETLLHELLIRLTGGPRKNGYGYGGWVGEFWLASSTYSRPPYPCAHPGFVINTFAKEESRGVHRGFRGSVGLNQVGPWNAAKGEFAV